MNRGKIIVWVIDFCLWLGAAMSGFLTLYFLGPAGNLKVMIAGVAAMIFFLSARDPIVKWLRKKFAQRNQGA